jgi:hypothetical protein
LEREWQQQPFVSINVREKCKSYEENLFGVYWPGTKSGCRHRTSLFTNGWVEEYSQNEYYNRNRPAESKRSCDYIFARDSVNMDLIFGKQICGLRGGLSFS